MFFTPWYNTMLVTIFATIFYQKLWMKKNGFRVKEKGTIEGRILVWMLLFLPIANTFLGIMCLILLLLFTFKEDLVREAFEENKSFEKIK